MPVTFLRTLVVQLPMRMQQELILSACFTWLLIYKEQHYADRSMEQAKATLDLMQYMLSDSVQQTTATVHYAPLPKKAIEQSLQNLKACDIRWTADS